MDKMPIMKEFRAEDKIRCPDKIQWNGGAGGWNSFELEEKTTEGEKRMRPHFCTKKAAHNIDTKIPNSLLIVIDVSTLLLYLIRLSEIIDYCSPLLLWHPNPTN